MKACSPFALLLMLAAVSAAVQAQDMDEPATGQIRGTLLTPAIAAAFVAPPLPATVASQTTPQSTDDPCFHARPAPACRFFPVTDFGVFGGWAREVVPDYPFPESTGGVIVEWGVMRNLGPRNAIGVSWFFAFNGDGLSTGPTMRYHRWLKGGRSLDFGVGTPINRLERNPNNVGSGSVLGFAKYNPVPWFGVAVRPEVVRRSVCLPPVVGPCGTVRTVSTPRVLVGIELSERPGAIMSGIFGGLLLLGAVALGGL